MLGKIIQSENASEEVKTACAKAILRSSTGKLPRVEFQHCCFQLASNANTKMIKYLKGVRLIILTLGIVPSYTHNFV